MPACFIRRRSAIYCCGWRSPGCSGRAGANVFTTNGSQAVLRNRQDLKREQLDRTRELMDQAVPDCLVSGYEGIEATLALPDPDDRHVLAAAIKCGAGTIVTYNLKDFPDHLLAPLGYLHSIRMNFSNMPMTWTRSLSARPSAMHVRRSNTLPWPPTNCWISTRALALPRP